jgi:hypothetical protein
MAISQEIRDRICEEIAAGRSLREIVKEDWAPHRRDVHKELIADAAFADQYARAREAQADVLFDEIQEIADDARNDWMERNGQDAAGWQLNGEHVQRSRLRIDARRWMAGKLRPKKYGERLDIDAKVEHVGLADALKQLRSG